MIRKRWVKKWPGIYDRDGSTDCAIYRQHCLTNGRFYRFEYEPQGLTTPLPLPDYGEALQTSGGGVRLDFDTLREALDGAERYLKDIGAAG